MKVQVTHEIPGWMAEHAIAVLLATGQLPTVPKVKAMCRDWFQVEGSLATCDGPGELTPDVEVSAEDDFQAIMLFVAWEQQGVWK